MKQPVKSPTRQFYLPLLNLPPLAVPDDKRRELALALVELLVDAARPQAQVQIPGGGDEPKTNG
jgi:hypothetical protein